MCGESHTLYRGPDVVFFREPQGFLGYGGVSNGMYQNRVLCRPVSHELLIATADKVFNISL